MMLESPVNRGPNVLFSTNDSVVAWPLSCFVNAISGNVLHIQNTYVERRMKSSKNTEMKIPITSLNHRVSEPL